MLKQVRALHSAKARGQAMVEYALILALVALALAAIFVVTGSAVGNVFSNTVYNLVGQDPNAVVQLTKYGGPNAFWETVTWVAEHPYQVTLAATLVKNPSLTPSPGPSPTPSNTIPPQSPSPTATFTPSPTYADVSYPIPFFDAVDNTNSLRYWRLDNSVYLGGSPWFGKYYSNKTFSGNPDYSYWNYKIDPTYAFNINFDWGTNKYPIQNASLTWPTNRSAGFSIRYTRDIYLAADANLRFTAAAADSVVVYLDGLPIITRTSPATLDTPIDPYEHLVTAGPHTLQVDYAELDGNQAGVKLDISLAGGATGSINPDDHTSSDAASRCEWGPLKSANSASLQYMFDDDTTSTDGVGPDLTCNLELRGSIDLGAASNPVLTFWDVWDFTGSSTASAKLQVAEYKADRSMVWTDVNLHSPGESNYQWTRQAVSLSSFVGKKIALRFVITNPGDTSGKRRWYVDDISVAQQNDPNVPKPATVGSFWDLNSSAQKKDFIYDGATDANGTSNSGGRWDLTSNHTYGSGTAWDDSPGMSPSVFSEGKPRVHYLELRQMVDLSIAPTKDLENDTGEAELSFWTMWNLNVGSKIQVEWTTDSRDTPNQDDVHWTVLGGTPLADATFTQLNSGSNMSFFEFPLGSETGVPQTTRFRLRFAMYLDSTTTWTDTSGGWWIDNIYLERASPPQFQAYPFTDTAEDASNLAAYWLTPGSWGRVSGQGRNGSAAYADSPSGNYQPSSNNPLIMKKYLDLNNDTTPGHSPLYGATPVKPTLTFWQWRNLAAGTAIYVDMYISEPHQDGGLWKTIWKYEAGSSHSPIAADDQEAWERVQIDLIKAYEDATGISWSTITTNDDNTDDDVRLQFRIQSATSDVADGMSIDDISIADYSEDEFHLWDTGTSVAGFNGNGTSYLDDMENNNAQPTAWSSRWYAGGEWDTVTRPGSDSVSNKAATDSPGRNYHAHELSIMEMKKIIDLRGVVAADQPVAYAWMLRKLDDTAKFSWQISIRDPLSTTQDYDKVLGWSGWTPVLSTGNIANENEEWQRVQINLLPYIGQEIKLRLVLDTTGSIGSTADGLYLDDVQFAFIREQRIFPLPFHDVAQSTFNWVTEGQWGLAPDRFKGSTNSSAPLGNNAWQETYLSCDIIDPTTLCNSQISNYTLLEAAADDIANTTSAHPGSVLTSTINDPLLRSYSSTTRPGNSTDPKWSSQWMGRITRDVTVEALATFDFTLLANGGVKAKIDGPIGGSSSDQVNPTNDWNLILDWNTNDGVAQADKPLTLPAGNYKITIDWLENLGNAFMSFSATNANFSFTDTPNTPNGGGGYDVVKAPNNSDSSLMLKGALNLTTATNPILIYYTEFDIGVQGDSSSTQARVEVSTDGGFTWTSDHLADPFGPTTMDNPVIDGGSQLTDWVARQHNLTAYAGTYLNLRFRLVTKTQPDSISVTGWHDGWYLAEIDVNQ